ncbi:hypothetical protein O987_11142 [Comamonas testosteroni TK102]|uniref:Uncharacterized protein n=1 Tax=Comamonas testosteroni TK102 TaxID=1392005 RepID=A0A076PKW2_COMTE|nr:hypothetical protein O987_11142 [Comamonas testosteroni TK102]
MRIDLAGHSPGWALALPLATAMAISAQAAMAWRRFAGRAAQWRKELCFMVLSPGGWKLGVRNPRRACMGALFWGVLKKAGP